MGFTSLFNDTRTEYPNALSIPEVSWNSRKWGYLPSLPAASSIRDGNSGLNVLQRFNIYPEVLLAGLYRVFKQYDLLDSTCFQMNVDGVSLFSIAIIKNLSVVGWVRLPSARSGGSILFENLSPMLRRIICQ